MGGKKRIGKDRRMKFEGKPIGQDFRPYLKKGRLIVPRPDRTALEKTKEAEAKAKRSKKKDKRKSSESKSKSKNKHRGRSPRRDHEPVVEAGPSRALVVAGRLATEVASNRSNSISPPRTEYQNEPLPAYTPNDAGNTQEVMRWLNNQPVQQQDAFFEEQAQQAGHTPQQFMEDSSSSGSGEGSASTDASSGTRRRRLAQAAARAGQLVVQAGHAVAHPHQALRERLSRGQYLAQGALELWRSTVARDPATWMRYFQANPAIYTRYQAYMRAAQAQGIQLEQQRIQQAQRLRMEQQRVQAQRQLMARALPPVPPTPSRHSSTHQLPHHPAPGRVAETFTVPGAGRQEYIRYVLPSSQRFNLATGRRY